MSEKNFNLSRRDFVVRSGFMAGGATLGMASAQGAESGVPSTNAILPKRLLGKTGASITRMTLGTAPSGFALPASPQNVADCVKTALDLGINSIDTAPAYQVAEEGVGMALGSRRKDVFLATKVLADTIEEAEKSLSNSLKLLKTDCVDLVYFHSVGACDIAKAMEPDGVFTWLIKQKQAGKARFLGISGHNRPARFARFLESGEVDVLLAVVNFADQYTYGFEADVLPIARKNRVGIIAMKVFGGAKDSAYTDPKSPSQMPAEHLPLAVRYALGVPGVVSLNLGAQNPKQVRQNVQTVTRSRPLDATATALCQSLGKQFSTDWGPHFGPRTEDEVKS